MKKSILNIILIVLVLTNTVLTGVLVFALLGPIKDTNNLVNKICKALDLELEIKDEVNINDIPIDDLEYYSLNEKLTILLKTDSDNKTHYAVLYPTLALYTKDDNYSKYSKDMEKHKAVIAQHIQDVVQRHTYSDMISNPAAVREEAVKDLQKLYDSKFIVEVIFDKTTLQ